MERAKVVKEEILERDMRFRPFMWKRKTRV